MGERRRSLDPETASALLAVDESQSARCTWGGRRRATTTAAARARLQRHLDWHPVLFSDKLDESVVCAKFIFQAHTLALAFSSSSSTPTR
jgi:hypothetical protein